MDTVPLVSIVVPCYRGERYLAEAIESCLRQSHRNFEVVVVDDASPDRCAEIATRYVAADDRVRLIRHPRNKGVSHAFNTGFAAARGAYFARLAQDDVFRADAITIMLDRIRSEPEVGLVYCDMQLIDADGRFMHMLPTEEVGRALLPAHRVGVCVLWSRAAWETVGPFDPRYDTADDYEFFLRVSRRFRLAKCAGEAPFYFRYHPAQGGVQLSKQQDYAYVLAQLAHYKSLVRTHMFRPAYWRKIVTCWIRARARKRVWMRSAEYREYLRKRALNSGADPGAEARLAFR
ncbi:glycosyltransferase family 2 protein [Frigoriglobus tundricola]|uniref:GT2 family glycosyltransferase n=1 Tax=Frigoriglobus tundricola TaxID=2774151 RepID=A0A6M5YVL5_9BACT|nr:glycosyltransferase [Frigoriglobus tundricola]QJW98065.1 GT2 family glycosyltransferase [Frigoriglobus tundricola]